jgi:hypothetical protein
MINENDNIQKTSVESNKLNGIPDDENVLQ